MGHDAGRRLQAPCQGRGLAHQHQGAGPVGDRTGVGGGDGAVGGKRRAQAGNLLDGGLVGLFIVADQVLALAGVHRYRGGFRAQGAGIDRLLGAGQGFDGEGVHLLAGEAAFVGGTLGETAHRAAGIGVFQAVQEHVVVGGPVAAAQAAARAQQQVGGIAHTLHAPGDHYLVGAGNNAVVAEDGRLHTAAAGLVDGHGSGSLGNPRANRGLAGGALLEACRQYAAHEHLVNVARGNAGAFDGGGDGGAGQRGGRYRCEAAQQSPHGGAGAAENDYRVAAHGVLPWVNGWRQGGSRATGAAPVANRAVI